MEHKPRGRRLAALLLAAALLVGAAVPVLAAETEPAQPETGPTPQVRVVATRVGEA